MSGVDLLDYVKEKKCLAVIIYIIGFAGTYFCPALSKNGLLCGIQCLFWFTLAEVIVKLDRYPLFVYLMECSFFIYIMHVDMQWNVLRHTVLYPLVLIPREVFALPGALLLGLTICFAVDLAACCCLYSIMKRCSPIMARILTGRL